MTYRWIQKHRGEFSLSAMCAALDATNHKAEQAIRPAVVNRKVWGGNRTQEGAKAQGILLTVVETIRQRAADVADWISQTLCAWPSPVPVPSPQAATG